MIREIVKFLRWGWQRFETWQRVFLAAMLVQVTGWFVPGTVGWAMSVSGMTVVFGYMLKWFVWDSIKTSWHKYKSERNELLTTIKNSDNERSRQV